MHSSWKGNLKLLALFRINITHSTTNFVFLISMILVFITVKQIGKGEYILDFRDVSPLVALATALLTYTDKRLVISEIV